MRVSELASIWISIQHLHSSFNYRATALVTCEYRLALAGAAIQVVTLVLVPFSLSWSFVPSIGPVESGAVALAVISTPLAVENALTNVSLNALVSLNATVEAQGGAFGLTPSASGLA